MNIWKFNTEVPGDQPKSIPTLDDIKKWYYNGSWWSEPEFLRTAIYRAGGWAFSFRDELKKFIVKFADGDLKELWAPNRTLLRKAVHRRVKYILDIPREKY